MVHPAERQHLRAVFACGDVADRFAPRAHSRRLGPEMAVGVDLYLDAAIGENALGYDRDQINYDLNGFGYLAPKQEKLSTLGTLWDSSIFENRAPQGKVLLRSMMGGACFPQYIKLTDAEVESRVRGDLERTMGITLAPQFIRIFRAVEFLSPVGDRTLFASVRRTPHV